MGGADSNGQCLSAPAGLTSAQSPVLPLPCPCSVVYSAFRAGSNTSTFTGSSSWQVGSSSPLHILNGPAALDAWIERTGSRCHAAWVYFLHEASCYPLLCTGGGVAAAGVQGR